MHADQLNLGRFVVHGEDKLTSRDKVWHSSVMAAMSNRTSTQYRSVAVTVLSKKRRLKRKVHLTVKLLSHDPSSLLFSEYHHVVTLYSPPSFSASTFLFK
jgi:hypothetical protein